ncbi:hypothetical protein BJ508DRAFT_311927 [Ascobolus immersus RN42]|uniref:Uncharacterized protein n=1 Tax=Ascobolus immersus RN42 TaxID=1160509 RepID=A0A3N4HNW2_ASCIM|nr:hypothetical protein BJ508DRAFT_311927 [Ascobolus immersus RN42]
MIETGINYVGELLRARNRNSSATLCSTTSAGSSITEIQQLIPSKARIQLEVCLQCNDLSCNHHESLKCPTINTASTGTQTIPFQESQTQTGFNCCECQDERAALVIQQAESGLAEYREKLIEYSDGLRKKETELQRGWKALMSAKQDLSEEREEFYEEKCRYNNMYAAWEMQLKEEWNNERRVMESRLQEEIERTRRAEAACRAFEKENGELLQQQRVLEVALADVCAKVKKFTLQ